MTEPNKTKHPITRFLEKFNVKSDRLATEHVDYDEENGIFLHSNAETWGESVRVSVEINGGLGAEVLSLEGYDEESLITDLADLFASVDFDQDAFTKAVQVKYAANNEI